MGYQPRHTKPVFVDENGKPIPPGMFTGKYDTRNVFALFGCGLPSYTAQEMTDLAESSPARCVEPQSFDSNRSGYVPPLWGVSMQEAADALASLVMPAKPEPIGDSGDGINPCGYDELTPYLLGKEDFIEDEEKP